MYSFGITYKNSFQFYHFHFSLILLIIAEDGSNHG